MQAVQSVLSQVETPQPKPEAVEEKWSICDPLEPSNWDSLLTGHANASAFHTQGWARVLHDTYGHIPLYFSRFANGRLTDLLPVMEVRSRLTGRRGVSLPFTDFCEPLTSSLPIRARLHDLAVEYGQKCGWKYLECRSNASWNDRQDAAESVSFHGHVIQLEKNEDALVKQLEGGVRRGIRKAQACGLRVEFETSLEAMRIFYNLHCKTRKRHGLPPQPFRFFANISRHLMQKGHGFLALTTFNEKPIAALVFLHHGREALYKFGASDYEFQNLRPNNIALWRGILHCAALGCARLHLGRTSLANEGLRRFKLGFGASEETMVCRKYDFTRQSFVRDVDRAETWMNNVWRCFPVPALRLAGEAIYPHLS